MGTVTYRFLDERMSPNDKTFYQKLGERVARLRKEQHITQVELAERLGISQQLMAAYERGQRKIPASLLPVFSNLFAVPVEELLGMKKLPAKRGPASRLQLHIEQISRLPRSKQRFVIEMLEALIKQQSASE